MTIFFFYIAAISLVLTVCAALADGLGWLYPDWLTEADESLEDSFPTGERGD